MSTTSIVDLANVIPARQFHRADICIIGAGAAGIYTAVRLSAQGCDVVLLEAGDRAATDGSTLVGADAEFPAGPYPGATAGRYFGVGGTTTQWGGFLIPHSKHDLRPTQSPFDVWAHIVRVVETFGGTVLQSLGWDGADPFATPSQVATAAVREAAMDLKAGLMLPHARKNFASLLRRGPRGHKSLTLFCNAMVTAVEPGDDGGVRLCRVQATSPNGKKLFVEAGHFIVAAGAIESARILLEINEQCAGRALRPTSATGCYLADHLSVPVARVTPETRRAAVNLFGPRFEHGWMRTFRLLERTPDAGTARAFLHFTFDTESAGFRATKEVLRAFQARRRPRVAPRDFVAGLGDVARLGVHRYVGRRLYVRQDRDVQLQLDVEQTPLRANRVMLGDARDRFGRPAAAVVWRISVEDRTNIAAARDRFLKTWPRVSQFPQLELLPSQATGVKPHDAYHPVGTCRLGRDAEAVVDEDLKVWGMSNLWVVSTGVLPSAGTANPTFTMLCLAERLVGHLKSRVAATSASGEMVGV